MQEEKAKLEAERAENARILEELKELKKQMEMQKESASAEGDTAEEGTEKE